jgi:hypothetical protein
MRLFALLLGVLLAGPAWAEPLAVKPGLWEVTTDGLLNGLPKALTDRLARLPADQQAKLQKYLDAAGVAGGGALVRRICITPALLQRPLAGTGHGCTRALVGSSATSLEVQVSCSHGTHQGNGTLRLTVTDPEHVTGSADGQLTGADGSSVTLRRTGRAHWIAAECGGVAAPG